MFLSLHYIHKQQATPGHLSHAALRDTLCNIIYSCSIISDRSTHTHLYVVICSQWKKKINTKEPVIDIFSLNKQLFQIKRLCFSCLLVLAARMWQPVPCRESDVHLGFARSVKIMLICSNLLTDAQAGSTRPEHRADRENMGCRSCTLKNCLHRRPTYVHEEEDI